VPVRGREGTAGFLEALSSRPHVFTEEHLSLLQRLAEIGKVANDRELRAELRTKTSGLTKSSDTFVRPQHIIAASIPEEALTADLFGERSDKLIQMTADIRISASRDFLPQPVTMVRGGSLSEQIGGQSFFRDGRSDDVLWRTNVSELLVSQTVFVRSSALSTHDHSRPANFRQALQKRKMFLRKNVRATGKASRKPAVPSRPRTGTTAIERIPRNAANLWIDPVICLSVVTAESFSCAETFTGDSRVNV